ncbi:unnamed protein product [Cuscuta campestris]|uniref:RNase H type-1 domain-containing protein n=1 Tax=Cuscuta campestris TaxID=132261 RepID=A0A484LEF0_9ASTE|nr:unnamed protein product [Cuscuta campestris]
MSSSQQINATSAQVQATNEGASIPVAATIPVISAPVLPLGLSSVPTASVISPFVTPVPSAGPRVTFPPSMTQFMNDPANLQAIQGFGQVMAMCQQNGGMPFLPAEGSIVLPVELGSGEKTVWKKMRFIVVDIKCVHNAILGRPGINKVGAVISMPHLCMKFHTPGGVGEVKGDQRNARECYARAVKKMTRGVNVISQEITKGETREKLEPEAETVEIELHPGDSSRMVRIGANLPEDLKEQITRVLQEYAGIFAWSVADMPGIDRPVICHRLAVREGSRPVRQKKRYLASDRRDFVKKEVKDLLSVDLPVNKPTEQWWEMAVDGASGPRGYGGGIVFTTPEGFKIYHAIVFNFKLMNNEAEYKALAGGLRLAQALKISRVSIKSDSSLIVGQVTGNMEAREGRMAQYKDLVLALLKGFREFKVTQIPWAENADADLLSKLTQYAPEHVSKLARVEILDHSSIEKLEVAAITAGSQFDRSNLVGADDHWMYDLMEYLTDGSLPEQDDRARKVKLRAPRFQILDGKLYKRAFGGPLLRCLTNREAERVIAEVHEGVCAAHQMSPAELIGRTYPRRASWVDRIHLDKPTETQARTWHAGYYTGLAQYNRKKILEPGRGARKRVCLQEGLDLEEGSNRTYTGP